MKDLEKLITECERNARADSEIDTSDIPPLTDEQLAQMKPSHLGRRKACRPAKKGIASGQL